MLYRRGAMRLAVLMPARDEAGRLARALSGLSLRASEVGSVTVFLIDDGSVPAVEPSLLPHPTPFFRMVLARHAVNLGQGAALETARQMALAGPRFDAYVTMDADGQHDVNGAFDAARAVERGADVVFGNRFTGASRVPLGRRAVLFAARLFDRALTGLALADAHNGLRAFSHKALLRITIRQNRMAHATEIKQKVSRAGPLVIVEVPVTVRYSEETLAKGQRASGAVSIVRDLFFHFLFGDPA